MASVLVPPWFGNVTRSVIGPLMVPLHQLSQVSRVMTEPWPGMWTCRAFAGPRGLTFVSVTGRTALAPLRILAFTHPCSWQGCFPFWVYAMRPWIAPLPGAPVIPLVHSTLAKRWLQVQAGAD